MGIGGQREDFFVCELRQMSDNVILFEIKDVSVKSAQL